MRSHRRCTLTLVLTDIAGLVGWFVLFAYLRGSTAGVDGLWALLLPIALQAFALHLVDGYRMRTDMLSADYTSVHLIAMVGATLTTILLTFVVIPAGFALQGSRAVVALAFSTQLVTGLMIRRRIYLGHLRWTKHRTVLFYGEKKDYETFAAECRRLRMPQDVKHLTASASADVSSGIEDAVSTYAPIEALVLQESTVPGSQDRLMRLYGHVPIYTLELFQEIYWRKIPLHRVNYVWLFQAGFAINRNPAFGRLKRLSDCVLAALGLLLASPLLVIAGLVIRAQDGEDGGPVIFRQRRIGVNQQGFMVYKLRTMRPNSAAQPAERYTAQNDPRVTRFGSWLRATRLDEFPQLWNVLKGDMSLIGPRAEWDELVRDYEREIPAYHFRHLVRPGITGWAQVNYPYGANLEDTRRKLEYDLYYIRHFSFRLDAAIVLKTIHTMLFGKGR